MITACLSQLHSIYFFVTSVYFQVIPVPLWFSNDISLHILTQFANVQTDFKKRAWQQRPFSISVDANIIEQQNCCATWKFDWHHITLWCSLWLATVTGLSLETKWPSWEKNIGCPSICVSPHILCCSWPCRSHDNVINHEELFWSLTISCLNMPVSGLLVLSSGKRSCNG